jgi:hypothetical protein
MVGRSVQTVLRVTYDYSMTDGSGSKCSQISHALSRSRGSLNQPVVYPTSYFS